MRRFALVTTGVSSLFWLLGLGLEGEYLVPGLPASAGMFVAPVLGAWAAGASPRALADEWAACVDVARHRPGGLLAVVAMMPMAVTISWVILKVRSLDTPARTDLTWLMVALLACVFLLTALCEEIGWTQVMAAPMITRFGLPLAGVLLGGAWAGLHVIPYVQGGRSPGWIWWQCLFTVAFRVLTLATYDIARKALWPAVLVHASYNLAWACFPVHGSHYDPQSMAAVTGVLAVGAALAAWRLHRLAHGA